jgi:pantothenate kinase
MDGFHLANAELARLGFEGRKGAPETFDAAGFVNLLRRLRAGEPSTVYAPTFNRAINESIGSAIPVAPDVRVVVTEGNYLLLDTPPWDGVRPLLDLALYLDAPHTTRHSALVRRQLARGLSRSDAQAWAGGSDAANARLIESTRDRADRILART